MTHHLIVGLQAEYTESNLSDPDGGNVELVGEIKEKFPTLEIELFDDERDGDDLIVHHLEADDPMDIVNFVLWTKDLTPRGNWEAIQGIVDQESWEHY